MSLAFTIYLLGVVDPFKGWLLGLTIVGVVFIALTTLLIPPVLSEGSDAEVYIAWFKKTHRKVCPIVGVCLVAWLFIPSKSTLASMIFIPKIAESGMVQKGYEGLEVLVDEWLEELRPPSRKTEKGGEQ